MEFYDKFVDRFLELSKVNNPNFSNTKAWQILRTFDSKFLGKHDVFTLTMLYMNGPHKILKFICQKQPSHPRNICTEH